MSVKVHCQCGYEMDWFGDDGITRLEEETGMKSPDGEVYWCYNCKRTVGVEVYS